jgi:hypothetical protein
MPAGLYGTVQNKGIDAPLSKKYIRGENAENFNPIVNGRMMRDPLRTLYIHSVSPRSFTLRNPPLFPRLEIRGTDPEINKGRWITCATVPDPIPQISADNERGGNRMDDNDAWAALCDLLNPLCGPNESVNPYVGSNNPDFYSNRRGTIFVLEGIFPSQNEVPTEEELKKAEECRDKRRRWLVAEAKKLAAKSTKALNEFLDTNPQVHEAMDALRQTAPWHQNNALKVSCANCGDEIDDGLAFHKSSVGILCIIDPQRAFKAGAINQKKFEELTGAAV